MSDDLGCRFSVNSADFLLCLRKFCGQADRGRLAGQQREFKIYRKSTAQMMTKVVLLGRSVACWFLFILAISHFPFSAAASAKRRRVRSLAVSVGRTSATVHHVEQ